MSEASASTVGNHLPTLEALFVFPPPSPEAVAVQAPQTSVTPIWLQALYSPTAVIAAVAFLFRFVLVPALMKLMRQDLAPELARLEEHNQAIPRIDGRVGTMEDSLSALSGIPVALARIEEQLKTLLKDRKHA